MDIVFELKLIPGDTTSLCPPFRMGAYGGQVLSRMLALIHLIVQLLTEHTLLLFPQFQNISLQ